MRIRPHLKSSTWLSSREANELFFWFVRWGQHRLDHLRNLPDIEIENILQKQGYSVNEIIHQLQKNPHTPIPLFENLLSTKDLEIQSTTGTSVKFSFLIDNVELPPIETKSGSQIRLEHKSKFSAACTYRNLAISESSIDHIYSMIVSGVSSIESYINVRAFVHEQKTGNKIVKDIYKDRTPLKKKIMTWLPEISIHAQELENSDIIRNFDRLLDIRHNQAIHHKMGESISSLDEAAEILNAFRVGIAGLMVVLNQLFGEQLESELIRAMLYPTVSAIYPPIQN